MTSQRLPLSAAIAEELDTLCPTELAFVADQTGVLSIMGTAGPRHLFLTTEPGAYYADFPATVVAHAVVKLLRGHALQEVTVHAFPLDFFASPALFSHIVDSWRALTRLDLYAAGDATIIVRLLKLLAWPHMDDLTIAHTKYRLDQLCHALEFRIHSGLPYLEFFYTSACAVVDAQSPVLSVIKDFVVVFGLTPSGCVQDCCDDMDLGDPQTDSDAYSQAPSSDALIDQLDSDSSTLSTASSGTTLAYAAESAGVSDDLKEI